jgi:pimeloyl-ACP methyl ester carboxylesterase
MTSDPALRPIVFPKALRATYRGLHALSPRLAARYARRLFFTPPPARRGPEQHRILGRAQRFERATERGRVVVWSWGEGPAVLMVHGWGGQAGQMTPFVEPLLRRGLRPIAFDAPGHGESPGLSSSGWHFSAAVESLATSENALAGVVGHSFGCVGLTLALEAGVAVQNAAFLAPPAGFGTFLQRFGDGLGIDDDGRRRLRASSERWLAVDFERLEPRHLAPGRSTPLLVVHDRGDDEIAFSEGQELAERWPGSTLVPTEGLGHYRLLREPRVVERVADFVAAGAQAVAAAKSRG